MPTLFIINATSGRARDRDPVRRAIEASCRGEEFDIRLTRTKGDLDEVFEQIDRYDVVFAVGGDGTVNEIGRRLIASGKTLGILPAGSGNGFARHLRIPMSIPAALEARRDSVVTAIDTATVGEFSFLGTFGVGFDAIVASRFAQAGTRGLETYIREGLRAFTSFAAEEYEIVVDGATHYERAILVTVANSNQYGNEARIAPAASIRDGMLDVVVLRESRLVDAADVVRRLFLGSLRDCSYLATMKGRLVTIRRANEGPAHIDGDPIVLGREITVDLHPASLKVLVPKKAAALI